MHHGFKWLSGLLPRNPEEDVKSLPQTALLSYTQTAATVGSSPTRNQDILRKPSELRRRYNLLATRLVPLILPNTSHALILLITANEDEPEPKPCCKQP